MDEACANDEYLRLFKNKNIFTREVKRENFDDRDFPDMAVMVDWSWWRDVEVLAIFLGRFWTEIWVEQRKKREVELKTNGMVWLVAVSVSMPYPSLGIGG